MADSLQLNRLTKFFGGITNNDRDKREGVCLNIEEFDIFINADSMEPTTIFVADSVITRLVSSYCKDDGNNVYALGRDTSGTPLSLIWKKTTASADAPGAWASFFTSSATSSTLASIAWLKWDAGTSWIYYTTGADSATSRTIRRVDTAGNNDTANDSASTAMTLTGFTGTGGFDRIPTIKIAGELYFGNGQYVAKIDSTGVFTEKAFTIPNGWRCVSFAPVGDNLAIFSKSIETGENTSKVFYWDLTSLTGVLDEVTIPMGGAQIVVNHNEILRAFVCKNGNMRIYQLTGKFPIKTHDITDGTIGVETDLQPVIPDASKFIKDNIIYFGLFKTDKTGLYALGQVEDQRPLALILARRFGTTDYSLHKPIAAYATGPNFYASYDDNGTKTLMKMEGNNSPTRSSNATYESVWLDANTPETVKEFPGFMVMSKPIPASCNIKIDARVDNASAYDSNALFTLDNSNDQVFYDGNTADTSWYRDWTSVVGRVLQVRIRCTSSGTSKPTIYLFSFFTKNTPII